ncbi:organic cation transporter protein [Lepeophtheirus salmonis]|uniref:organic cation transporter protein n=1 Tax=Lepeophtheirus salmonis TaxID=72036 RepID=UPI001AE96B7C|nr:organic cation transporter protein-like [Lepeophtheirus salmonis]XP_040574273.1 organic cation transporter protein-like [Lepeophtheirus salmonis]
MSSSSPFLAPEEEDSSTPRIKNFDDLLIRYGQFGPYQKLIYLLFSFPYVMTSMQLMGWVFVGAELPHRCLLPNETQGTAMFHSQNLPEEELFQCVYKFNNESCEEYVYDTSVVRDSVVKNWNLVCKDSERRARISAAPMIGYLFGGLFFGSLLDKIGRKLTFLVATNILFISGCFASVAPGFQTFLIARVIIGFAIPGVEATCFVMGMELVGPTKRTLAGILCWFFESIGLMCTVCLAYLLDYNWRLLQAIYSLPLILFVSYYWITPKSPRWLMSNKRYDEANDIICKMMKSNGYENSKPNVTNILKNIAQNEKKDTPVMQYTYFDLFRYPSLCIKTLILNWLWIVTSSLYYVLLLDQKELSTDPYIGFFITVALQIPGYIYVIYSLEHPFFGRRKSLIGMLFLTGICLVLHPFLHFEGSKWIRVSVSMMGRFAANCSYTILNLYSTEQYPTVVRGIGFSFSLTVSRLGGILAPYILLIGIYSPLVFGFGALIAGILTCTLPETLGRHLPETIEESEAIKPHCPCCYYNIYGVDEDKEEGEQDEICSLNMTAQ